MNTQEINEVIAGLTSQQLINELERHTNADILDRLEADLDEMEIDIKALKSGCENSHAHEIVMAEINQLDEWQRKQIAWDN